MVDLVKLDKTITELEESSKKIVKIKDMIAEIDQISAESKGSLVAIEEIRIRVNDVLKESTKTVEASKQANKQLEDYFTTSKEADARLKAEINTLLLEMKNENSSLYRNFESAILSKFELLKSDVVVENRKTIEDGLERIEKKIDKKSNLVIILVAITMAIYLVGIIIEQFTN